MDSKITYSLGVVSNGEMQRLTKVSLVSILTVGTVGEKEGRRGYEMVGGRQIRKGRDITYKKRAMKIK